MTEWRIVTNHDDFPEPPAGKPGQAKAGSWRRWLLLVGGIGLFLSAVGFFTLRRYRAEGQAALRDDLTAHIFEEETRRALNRPDEGLTLSEVPAAWAEAYWRTFQRREPPPGPGSILLTEIDFDGQCAVVTLALEGSQEVRAYCLQDERWRRAPVVAAAWGDEQPPLELPQGLRLYFRSRDQLFAETLARDLAAFFDQLDQLAGEKMSFSGPIDIIIEPHDLQAPLLQAEVGQIVLNSPWLTPPDPEIGLAGEAAVRFVLANLLLEQSGLFPTEPEATLPGARRFKEAAQAVMAMHLLLPPEAQDSLVESWRARLDGRWVSPFYVELLSDHPAPPTLKEESSARLMAGYIYLAGGLEALFLATQQLSNTNSWDDVFQTALGRLAVDLEKEAALYAQVQLDESEILIPAGQSSLPLAATLLKVDRSISTSLTAYLDLPGRSRPLLAELPANMLFQTSEGGALAAGCAEPGTRMEMRGAWLEKSWRLQASQVTIQAAAPLAVEPAPADTAAYVLAGPSYEPQALVAIRPDGSSVQLAPLAEPMRQVFPLPVTASNKEVHFLFRLDLPACDGVWFAHYEPSKGITGYWLAPSEPLQWVWRADKQDLVFFRSSDDQLASEIYASSGGFIPEAIGTLTNPPPAFVGWQVRTGQFVFYTFDFDATAVGLFDLASRSITFQSYFLLLRGRRLSPDGNWLAYVSSGRRADFIPDRLEMINLTGGSITVPLRVRVKEGVTPPVWSLYLDQPWLAILAGPAEDDDPLPVPTRLLVLSPDQEAAPQLVARAAEGEVFAPSPVFCSDGALLYQAKSGGEYRLLRQTPGQAAETLFVAAEPFHPAACP